MKVVPPKPFALPRVDEVPRSVQHETIGRSLRQLYDGLIAEGVPEHLASLVYRLEAGDQSELFVRHQRVALIVEDEPGSRRNTALPTCGAGTKLGSQWPKGNHAPSGFNAPLYRGLRGALALCACLSQAKVPVDEGSNVPQQGRRSCSNQAQVASMKLRGSPGKQPGRRYIRARPGVSRVLMPEPTASGSWSL